MRMILKTLGLGILLLHVGHSRPASAGSIEVAVGGSYSVTDSRWQTVEPVMAARVRLLDNLAVVGRGAAMRYAQPGILDSRYVMAGIGLEGSASLTGRLRMVGDVVPGVAFTRWHQLGLNEKATKLGVSFGAGFRGSLSPTLRVTGMVRRNLSEDSLPIFYADAPDLALPSVADTRVEVTLDVGL